MNTNKLIVISCLVFIIALIVYLIIKNNGKFKAFILKIDDKITKHNQKVEAKRDKIKNEDKEDEIEQKDEKIKKEKNGLFKSKSDNKNSNKDSDAKQVNKLKPSKAVEQIRPVLLPPNREAEERDIKLLEMKQRPEMIQSSPQKALDFKYGAKQTTSNQNSINRTPSVNSQLGQKVNNNKKNSANDDYISFSKENDNFNPLKRDTKRQFDDIKNFLQLPDNLKTAQQKGVSYNGKNFNTVDKIDPLHNMSKPYNTINSPNSMQTKTKYSRKNSAEYDMPTFNIQPSEREQLESTHKEDYSLSPEQENIDLNKLPNNLKKMIIQNILERKNYD